MKKEMKTRKANNFFKVFCACVMAVSIIFTSVALGELTNEDATYYNLYTQVLNCADNTDETSDYELLHIDNASVWKHSDSLSGFMFEGSNWFIVGECDTQTGVITRIFSNIPLTKGGLLMVYAVTFVLSGEDSSESFFEKYVPDDSVLRDLPFPEYTLSVNGGAEDVLLFEYTRNKPVIIHNEENACPMDEIVSALQK